MTACMKAISFMLVGIVLSVGAAFGSSPVPRTIEACVTRGVLTGSKYIYKVFVLANMERRPLDLKAFEGLMLRVQGNLLPGDNLYVMSIEVIAEKCMQQNR
jgi:hypothetical protein